MFPTSRKCLLCSGKLPVVSSCTNKFTRQRSTVPATATASAPPTIESEETLVRLPTMCPLTSTERRSSNSRLKSYNDIPGPNGLPVLGSLLDYMGNGPYSMKKMHLATIDRFRQYGPIFKETLAGTTYVHIIEPDDVKELIRHEGINPNRITLDPMVAYRKLRNRNIGMGNLQGDEWRRLRQPFNYLLFKPDRVNTYLPKVETCADDFSSLMADLRTTDGEVPNYSKQIQRWTLETITSIVLDTRIGFVEARPCSDAEKVITAANDFISGLGELMYSLPLYKYGIYTNTWKKFAAAQDFFYEFIEPFVQQTVDNMMTDDKDLQLVGSRQQTVREATFLESLLVMHSNKSVESICDLINDLLLGAVDTMSSMFSFLIYNLARNPDCQEKLYQEIFRVIPPGAPITPEVLQMLPYLKACVRESLRIFPSVDGTSRLLNKEVVLSGYKIPPNTIVRVHAVAGMMPEYVPEPDKYIPERWLRTSDRSISVNPYLTITFGIGPRMCAGRRLAEQQTYVGIIKLLQKFRFEWHHDDIELDFQITMRPSKPVQPKVIDRL